MRPGGFSVQMDGGSVDATAVLLATGVKDRVPDIPGAAECYGTSVHRCPYCDGWEFRDRRIAVVGSGTSPAGLALSLRTWTDAITACTNGVRLKALHRDQLERHDVAVRPGRILSGRSARERLSPEGRISCRNRHWR